METSSLSSSTQKKLSLQREACATADLDKELAVGRLVAGCELQDVTGNIFKGLGFRVWDLGFGVLGFGMQQGMFLREWVKTTWWIKDCLFVSKKIEYHSWSYYEQV